MLSTAALIGGAILVAIVLTEVLYVLFLLALRLVGIDVTIRPALVPESLLRK
ncbi:hypothetical protein K0C01_01965 [Salinarchaeum sp. IM2453]|uniref:hypothetical protein n=1 Tax=Salinarchaeum sp. IM2453 TaxID=2862870 RepID=UPI001C83B1AC|nr:hypothetical protein [Salinarchaeum sp. IM2453]QZA88956.1 hypothetical protein K0C01_01965 [Salinarchaeum sp. IM2453]